MANIPNMSLKTIQLNPTVFTPSKYQFQTADIGILERSLAQREARMEKAVQAKANKDKIFAELSSKMNPKESQFILDYQKEIDDKLNDSYDSGDYGKVYRDATTLGAESLKDPRVLGRIRSQQAWEEVKKTNETRVANKKVSQNALDWYNKTYGQYSYKDAIDDNGNYIEAPIWKPAKPLYDSMNWAEQIAIADKYVSPNKKSNKRSGGSDTTNADGTGGGNQWSSKSDSENKKAADILSALDNIIKQQDDGLNKAIQQFEVDKYAMENLQAEYDSLPNDSPEKENKKQQLDTLKSYMYDGNSIVDWKTYYLRRVTQNPLAEKMAYRYTSTESSRFINTDNQSTDSTINRPSHNGEGNELSGNYTPGNGSILNWSSVNVKAQKIATNSANAVNSAAKNTVKRFKPKTK